MIIDCHGHYTTEPKPLLEFRKQQVASIGTSAARPAVASLAITDDEIRETIEGAQLKRQRERGTDLTIFSPRASGMAHHLGDAALGSEWAHVCNELIYRVTTLFPQNFAGACQLPQVPGVAPANCIAELKRCVEQFGSVGCNLNPDPSGGHWTSPPLTDR